MSWIGAALIVACGYFFGIKISSAQGEQLKTVNSLVLMLEYMERRMDSARCPLYIVFSEYKDDHLESIGFLTALRACRDELPHRWENAVLSLTLDEDIKNELLYFGKELGRLPLAEQEKRIAAALGFLKQKGRELGESLPKKQKSTRAVALLIGMMTAIILL